MFCPMKLPQLLFELRRYSHHHATRSLPLDSPVVMESRPEFRLTWDAQD